MNYSLTYIAVILLTALGVDNAESVANAIFILIAAGIALYGRWRAGGVTFLGFK